MVVPYLFFSSKAKCRHNMLLRLPWQNSKSKRWNDSESSFQRLVQLVPFHLYPGKEWRCLLHTSYQFKLIHFCWRSFPRLVIANSQFTQFGCIMRLECSFHIGGKGSQELWCNEKPVLQHFRFQRASWHLVDSALASGSAAQRQSCWIAGCWLLV